MFAKRIGSAPGTTRFVKHLTGRRQRGIKGGTGVARTTRRPAPKHVDRGTADGLPAILTRDQTAGLRQEAIMSSPSVRPVRTSTKRQPAHRRPGATRPRHASTPATTLAEAVAKYPFSNVFDNEHLPARLRYYDAAEAAAEPLLTSSVLSGFTGAPGPDLSFVIEGLGKQVAPEDMAQLSAANEDGNAFDAIWRAWNLGSEVGFTLGLALGRRMGGAR